jgi:hypothetical protein
VLQSLRVQAEPMLEAVRDSHRTRSSPGKRPWPAATARGCSVEIDGVLQRLCVAGMSWRLRDPERVGLPDALEAPEVARALDVS